jgi:hypothetical protein
MAGGELFGVSSYGPKAELVTKLLRPLRLPHCDERSLDVLCCRPARNLREAKKLFGLSFAARDHDLVPNVDIAAFPTMLTRAFNGIAHRRHSGDGVLNTREVRFRDDDPDLVDVFGHWSLSGDLAERGELMSADIARKHGARTVVPADAGAGTLPHDRLHDAAGEDDGRGQLDRIAHLDCVTRRPRHEGHSGHGSRAPLGTPA